MGEKKEGSESTKEWAYCLMRGPHTGGRSIPLFNDTNYTRTSLYHTWPATTLGSSDIYTEH